MKKEEYEKLTGKQKNLIDQANKLFKNNNQKSIKTRYRYLAGEERFCKWLAENTNLQKIKNVKAKHFLSYTKFLKEKELSPNMVKTELSAVRFFQNLTGSRETLPTNTRLDLQKVNFGGVDRSWTNKEVKDALNLANSMGRTDVEMAIKIAYAFGCRTEEVMTLTTTQIKQGIKYRQLDLINTKGGKARGIDVNPASKLYNMQLRALQFAHQNTKSDNKVFCEKGQQMHKVIKSVQNWIYNNRNKFEEEGRVHRDAARVMVREVRDNKQTRDTPKTHITAHGLRHSYAHNLYQEFLQQKIDIGDNRDIKELEKEARLEVSILLGHGRDDVTRIYIPK